MKTKKILLVGKKGQLAESVLIDAKSFGFKITAFDIEDMDVTDSSQTREKIEIVNPDILINASAFNNLPQAEEKPREAMALNSEAVKNLASLCKEKNIIFVTYSTDYVFDGMKGSPYEETDEPNPLQQYGSSKLAGEKAALNIYPEKTFVIRTCGLYGGKKGSPKKGNFVLNIMKEAQSKEIIEVGSNQTVSPTYAGDLSKATLKLLNSIAESGIYHLVNEGQCNWSDFTKEIFKLAGISAKIKPVDRSKSIDTLKRPQFSALKNTRAKKLGIKLPSWKEGLKSYFKYLNSNA